MALVLNGDVLRILACAAGGVLRRRLEPRLRRSGVICTAVRASHPVSAFRLALFIYIDIVSTKSEERFAVEETMMMTGIRSRKRACWAAMLCIGAQGVLGSMNTAAAAPKGELVILQWLSGSELDTMHTLEAAFLKAYPGVTIREVPVTWSGDPRGGLRTALLGGEQADLTINTWPAFRRELVDANLLRPLDKAYDALEWGKRLDSFWHNLGSVDGHFYGLPYNYGDRSGLWYRTQTLQEAGITTPPADWAAFKDSFAKLKAQNKVPFVVPAKAWAHAEVFETLLLRVAGAGFSRDLAAHKVAWTDDKVKTTLRKWRDLLQAGCCAPPATMLGTEWDNAADQVLQNREGGYFLMGMWVNNRAKQTYKLDPAKDYGLFQFPAMGLGHDNASSLDSKEFVEIASGKNPEAAEAFMDFAIGPVGGDIIAKAGLSSPSKAVDPALYDPVIKASNEAVARSDNAFVLGDSLPSEVADEYRVQLQKFLQDPSDATIDAVTAAIEAKAAGNN